MNSTSAIRNLVILSAITISGLYFLSNKKNESVELPNSLKEIKVKDEVFVFNSEESFALHTRDGSVVYIDENSFEYSDGTMLKGDVEVSFKEYHNIMDVIKSRVKMTYDSAGVKYHLQSAGMFEISGKKNGKEIQVKNGKELRVDLMTQTNGGKFNFYKFENNNWSFLHKDESFAKQDGKGLSEIEEELINVADKIREIESDMPIKPDLIDDEKLNIKLDFKEFEFPELAGFKDVLFEFLDDEMSAESLEGFDWDFVEINKIEKEIYRLSVYSKGKKYMFNTKPVIGNHQKLGVFSRLFNKYKKELAVQTAIAKSLNVDKMSLLRSSENKRISSLITYKNISVNKSKTEQTRAKLIRSFQISSFGMFNSDCPANLPEGPMFVADFKAVDNDSLEHRYAYLVEKNTKRLFTFYPQNYSNFRCDPKSNNMIVVLTDSNRIYACDNKAFEGVGMKSTHEFKLGFIEVDSESELSIKNELNF